MTKRARPGCVEIVLRAVVLVALLGAKADAASYSTYTSWDAMEAATSSIYATPIQVTGGSGFTDFWFYGKHQFDSTKRYILGMRVYFQNRDVTQNDVAEIGYIDLQDGNRWAQIGTTTAWNWQQGGSLQWRPNSNDIVWNDRASDNSHFIA